MSGQYTARLAGQIKYPAFSLKKTDLLSDQQNGTLAKEETAMTHSSH